jgi:F0F1-type ATP synthase membrane subunit b/b'
VAALNAAQLNLNPLTQIDPIVIVAVIVIFVATYFALRRVFIMPYVLVMEKRERLFENADEMLDRAEALERESLANSEATVAAAATAAEELRVTSQTGAEEYRRQRVDAATQEASVLLESGRAEIAAARSEQSAKLRAQVQECVGLACDRLLGAHDTETVEAAVDRLMTRGTR